MGSPWNEDFGIPTPTPAPLPAQIPLFPREYLSPYLKIWEFPFPAPLFISPLLPPWTFCTLFQALGIPGSPLGRFFFGFFWDHPTEFGNFGAPRKSGSALLEKPGAFMQIPPCPSHFSCFFPLPKFPFFPPTLIFPHPPHHPQDQSQKILGPKKGKKICKDSDSQQNSHSWNAWRVFFREVPEFLGNFNSRIQILGGPDAFIHIFPFLSQFSRFYPHFPALFSPNFFFPLAMQELPRDGKILEKKPWKNPGKIII